MTMSTYTVIIEEDEAGELFFRLPDEITQGDRPWLEGDEVVWEVKSPSEVSLINKSWIMRNENGFG
jgi:hypothetical protein